MLTCVFGLLLLGVFFPLSSRGSSFLPAEAMSGEDFEVKTPEGELVLRVNGGNRVPVPGHALFRFCFGLSVCVCIMFLRCLGDFSFWGGCGNYLFCFSVCACVCVVFLMLVYCLWLLLL